MDNFLAKLKDIPAVTALKTIDTPGQTYGYPMDTSLQ